MCVIVVERGIESNQQSGNDAARRREVVDGIHHERYQYGCRHAKKEHREPKAVDFIGFIDDVLFQELVVDPNLTVEHLFQFRHLATHLLKFVVDKRLIVFHCGSFV